MGFEITWSSETPAIYLKMTGVVTPSEVMDINRETITLAQAQTAPVHIIIDTLEVTEIPTNLRWVMEMMRANPVAPTGWNIVVQQNALIHLMASTILGVLDMPCYFCATLDEARDFLASQTSQIKTIKAAL
jgi:hypothetical protein